MAISLEIPQRHVEDVRNELGMTHTLSESRLP